MGIQSERPNDRLYGNGLTKLVIAIVARKLVAPQGLSPEGQSFSLRQKGAFAADSVREAPYLEVLD